MIIEKNETNINIGREHEHDWRQYDRKLGLFWLLEFSQISFM